MKVCIHRGTKEIGGTCIEIESQGKRIVLDVGLPLDLGDPDNFPLHPILGFASPDPSLLGVVISHPHQDHYGLAHRLPEETPFLIGKAAESILAAAEVFSPAGLLLMNVRHLEDRKPIVLGPFTVNRRMACAVSNPPQRQSHTDQARDDIKADFPPPSAPAADNTDPANHLPGRIQ